MRFEILRGSADPEEEPRLQTFSLEVDHEMSVLEALLRLQEEQDPTLAFRYACRGAICGSCGMLINGWFNLACRTLVKHLSDDHILLEPLPNFRVIKDLVVDMDPFWEKYRQIQPWLHRETNVGAASRMSPEQREKIDRAVNCILCAICHGACPVLRRRDNFTGPAILTRLNRFLQDSRDERPAEVLERQDAADGVWSCHGITRCSEACPKDVRPADEVAGVKRRLVRRRWGRLWGKGKKSGGADE